MDTSTVAGRFAGPSMTEMPSAPHTAFDEVIDAIRRARIVPVVTVHDARSAQPLAGALADGGLPVVEITLRTAAGIEAVQRVANEVPTSLVGAGSVLSAGAAEEAIEAGARFIVSPGLDEGVVATALDHDVLVVPGIATATELLRATALGVNVVKLFPASVVGGPDLIRALSAVWPGVGFLPTGGVSPSDVDDYLALAQVVAVGGSWMVSRASVEAGDWDAVAAAAAAAARLVAEDA